jgi:predicted nucleotidyltransferase
MRNVEHLEDRLLRGLLATLRNELVLRHGPGLISLVLFGSRARGDQRPDSDIDLLLVARRPGHRDGMGGVREAFEASDDYRAWEAARGRPVTSIVPFTPEDARESKYLYLDMTEEAVLVYDQGDFMHTKLASLRDRLRQLGSYRVSFGDGSYMWVLKPGLRVGETVEF